MKCSQKQRAYYKVTISFKNIKARDELHAKNMIVRALEHNDLVKDYDLTVEAKEEEF
jgi:hypothetical protein